MNSIMRVFRRHVSISCNKIYNFLLGIISERVKSLGSSCNDIKLSNES